MLFYKGGAAMRITVLSDNLPARGLEAEWGLSLYLAYQGHALSLIHI